MKICRVIGKGDASVKEPGLEGTTLLVVQEVNASVAATGALLLAVDRTGAGVGDVVAVATGSAAIRALAHGDVPYDAMVVAIMDHLFLNGRQAYSKSEED